ncbi:MAG: hypothetical protein QM775_23105 [Pirellulales bacterium]
MTHIKGFRLYVKIGAAQTRKRLKGVGYGVRKVETAGKDRACVIHTATGDHRRALYAVFGELVDSPLEDDEDAGKISGARDV